MTFEEGPDGIGKVIVHRKSTGSACDRFDVEKQLEPANAKLWSDALLLTYFLVLGAGGISACATVQVPSGTANGNPPTTIAATLPEVLPVATATVPPTTAEDLQPVTITEEATPVEKPIEEQQIELRDITSVIEMFDKLPESDMKEFVNKYAVDLYRNPTNPLFTLDDGTQIRIIKPPQYNIYTDPELEPYTAHGENTFRGSADNNQITAPDSRTLFLNIRDIFTDDELPRLSPDIFDKKGNPTFRIDIEENAQLTSGISPEFTIMVSAKINQETQLLTQYLALKELASIAYGNYTLAQQIKYCKETSQPMSVNDTEIVSAVIYTLFNNQGRSLVKLDLMGYFMADQLIHGSNIQDILTPQRDQGTQSLVGESATQTLQNNSEFIIKNFAELEGGYVYSGDFNKLP